MSTNEGGGESCVCACVHMKTAKLLSIKDPNASGARTVAHGLHIAFTMWSVLKSNKNPEVCVCVLHVDEDFLVQLCLLR